MSRTLTTSFCDSIKPPAAGRVEIFDAATPGLALRVTERGIKSWSIIYRVAGKLRRDTLGRYPDLGVRAALHVWCERAPLIFLSAEVRIGA